MGEKLSNWRFKLCELALSPKILLWNLTKIYFLEISLLISCSYHPFSDQTYIVARGKEAFLPTTFNLSDSIDLSLVLLSLNLKKQYI